MMTLVQNLQICCNTQRDSDHVYMHIIMDSRTVKRALIVWSSFFYIRGV